MSKVGDDNAMYEVGKVPVGGSATVRFLPDADTSNLFFWVLREWIKLPFAGSVGGDHATDRPVTVDIPCIDMFGMTCPIIAEMRSWRKDDAKKALALKYYKRKSYLFQGLVVMSPFDEEDAPDNPIRRFNIVPQIYKIIHESLMNPAMDDLPTDDTGGRDFVIRQGDLDDYISSNWSTKTRPLSENEHLLIEQHGLFHLTDHLGRIPDADEVEAIKALFHASLAGKPFDTHAFGKYYHAYCDDDMSAPYDPS